MAVEFRLLGTVEATVDGRLVDLGPPRQVCVLVLLLVEANHVLPVDRLLDRVWPDRLPHSARGTLSSYLSRLKKCLAGTDEVTLVRRSGGYALTVDADAVDLHRFRRLLGLARAGGDDSRTCALLTDALALWRGEAFTGVDCRWLDLFRESLADERRTARREWTDLQLRLGHHAALIPSLAAQIEDDPLDEQLIAQLMLAQYRTGRQAEALDTFHQARLRLAGELGIGPGDRLRRLHREILSAGAVADPPAAGRFPRPRQLPTAPAVFTGRAGELARLTEAHATDRGALVAMVGAGGVGKTWLALRWAHDHVARFPDGQLYADLRGFDPVEEPTPPAVVVRSFLEALGVRPADAPLDVDAQAALYRSLLAGKQVLVLLDNARDAAQVIPLLPGGPRCCVLVTSRDDLGALVALRGARRLAVDLLDPEQSRRLLGGHLGARRVADEADAVAAVVRYCAGLPLALAVLGARAARRPDFPLALLAAELAREPTRLDALRAGDLRADLRAVLSCSYRVLPPEPARLFRLLGHVVGPDIAVDAAARLVDRPEGATREALDHLEQAHLVRQCTPGRYRTHDLVRLFARAVADGDEAGAAVDRLLDHYLDVAVRATSDDDRMAATRLDAEYENLVAAGDFAVEHDRPEHAWKLADALWFFRYCRGLGRDWVPQLTRALGAARGVGDAAGEAAITKHLGVAHFWHGDYRAATRWYRRALASAERAGDWRAATAVLHNLGIIHQRQGGHTEALELFERAVRLVDEHRMTGTTSRFVANSGVVLAHFGRVAEALDRCDRALRFQRACGLRHAEAHSLIVLGIVTRRAGRPRESADHLRRSLAELRRMHDRSGEVEVLNELGDTFRALHDPVAAAAAYGEALERADAIAHHYEQARAHAGVARCGPLEHAQRHRAAALAILTDLDVLESERERLVGPERQG
ncbi:AfsR/SARP family transcriptional regulator [Saccharothrix australiensis]|uniref:DNA-binding SARP family transcriptional activator n=1 Tax=Saccharothrix australiensis TaxID=2072 RepID=A0A495W1D1_9PSEU|nr:AfsR/SARP family transcriptional regulator [Saccharothrix australiensis]RKT53678.1 DNA-binding SARP family transcriptional activator [Saccharothrix australiensis]